MMWFLPPSVRYCSMPNEFSNPHNNLFTRIINPKLHTSSLSNSMETPFTVEEPSDVPPVQCFVSDVA